MNHAVGRLDHAELPDALPGVGEVDDDRTIDRLTLGPHPSAPAHGWHRWTLVIVTVLSSLAALAVIGGQDRREPGFLSAVPTALEVLVLGDTSAARDGCEGCFHYVDQLATAWSQGGRRRVRIDDQTVAADEVPSSMPALVESLRTDPEVQAAVSVADVILLALGSGDVTPPAPPARCRARQRALCPGEPIGQLRDSLAAWIDETDAIRQHRPVGLRLVTPPPSSGSPRQNDVARSACQIAAVRGVACVNLYNLARTDEHLVVRGSDLRHTQLTPHGHDVVTAQLVAIGIT